MKNLCFKTSILASFLFLLTFETQAQVTLDLGARVGINFSGVSINEEVDTLNNGTLKSPVFNFVLQFGIANKFFIQPELSFIRKGDLIDMTEEIDLGLFGTSEFKVYRKEMLRYVEIPVLLKYGFAAPPGVDLQVYAGPSFGFLKKRTVEGEVSFTAGTESQRNSLDEETDLDNNEDYNTTEIGLLIGGTLRAKAGPGKFSFDIRLATGLTSYTNFKDDAGNPVDSKNKYTTISVGYILPLVGPK